MLQPTQNNDFNVLKIIWGALLGSQVIYGVVLLTVLKEQEPQELQIPMVGALSMMAVVMCVMSFIIPKMLLKQAKKDVMKNPGDFQRVDLATLVKHFSSPFILRLALLESCAMFGFALAFLHKRMELFFPFAVLSIGLMLMNYPTEEKIRNAFKDN